MLDKLDNHQLQQLFQTNPVGILMQDNQGRISWMNETLVKMLGEDRQDQLLNQQPDKLGEPLANLFAATESLHLPGDDTHNDLWLISWQQALPDNSGNVRYFADITTRHQEQEKLRAELNDIIMVDRETGMRNRKGLYYSLEPQLSRSRRYDRPLSIIIMRLDCLERFKQDYNRDDALPLLKAISYLLSDQLRWADIVGRLDETDFLLVLPEIHVEDANKVADNLRRQLAELTMTDLPEQDFEITARFGVAEWHKGDDMGLLLMRARNTLDGDGANPQPAATV